MGVFLATFIVWLAINGRLAAYVALVTGTPGATGAATNAK